MALVERPDRIEKILPVGLVDVRLNKGDHNKVELLFICPCRQPGCTRSLKLSGSWRGEHPAKWGTELERLASSLLKKG